MLLLESSNASLLASLQRPDLRIVAGNRAIASAPSLARAFRVAPDGSIALGPSAIRDRSDAAFHLRTALELSLLVAGEDGAATGIAPALAWLAACRVAVLFARLDGAARPLPPGFAPLDAMAAASPPDRAGLAAVAACGEGVLAGAAVPLGERDARLLAEAWALIGPVEGLLGSGGDQRLAIDPDTRLNHYGCSHRPRPWALTYASSTASSLSERGFAGAEAARRRILREALRDRRRAALTAEVASVREGIATHALVPDGTGVVLTASGTDCELLALAIAAMPDPARDADAPPPPLVNILTAPDETGSGVPLAAIGRHFAADTACGAAVVKGEPVEGMPRAVRRADVEIRDPGGALIAPRAVDARAEALVADAVAGGERVLLHLLDVSKTGLLAPSIDAVARAARRGRGRVDVVVDACQTRLTRARLRSYVEIGWMVLVTGSKFFTGPPFCGALLVPPAMMRRLRAGRLPEGLAAYCGRLDWPADAVAADHLPDAVNPGMVLRWQAALAEMRAFAAVPSARKREILATFTAAVRDAIDANPDLERVPAPPLVRPRLGDSGTGWDDLQTIVPFLALDRDRRPLDLAATRRLYHWLNADVSAHLPPGLGAQERFLAALRCHVGQPAPVAAPAGAAGSANAGGGIAGALRISAGARLVSGEPSHDGIGGPSRLAREIADARACLDKLSLLLAHRDALERADPRPSFGEPAA